MDNNQAIILKFKDRFFKNLEKKNSWGKNEVQTLFLNTLIEVSYSEFNVSQKGLQEEDQSGTMRGYQPPQQIPKPSDSSPESPDVDSDVPF